MRRLSPEIEREPLRQAYYGIFHCHLMYGLIVWGLVKTDSSPLLMGSKFYNKLPLEIQRRRDKYFSSSIKTFLCKHAFYSLEEFMSKDWIQEDFS